MWKLFQIAIIRTVVSTYGNLFQNKLVPAILGLPWRPMIQ